MNEIVCNQGTQSTPGIKPRKWSVEEEDNLFKICSEFSDKIDWKTVESKFKELGGVRTLYALKAKWGTLKKNRANKSIFVEPEPQSDINEEPRTSVRDLSPIEDIINTSKERIEERIESGNPIDKGVERDRELGSSSSFNKNLVPDLEDLIPKDGNYKYITFSDKEKEEIKTSLMRNLKCENKIKLPVIKFNKEEILKINSLILEYRTEYSDKNTKKQWEVLTNILYTIIQYIESSRPKETNFYKNYIDKKEKEIHKVRQWIGKFSTEIEIRKKGRIRSDREKWNMALIRKVLKSKFKGQSIDGALRTLKDRLEILKDKVRIKREKQERVKDRKRFFEKPNIRNLEGFKTEQPKVEIAFKFWSDLARGENFKIPKILKEWRKVIQSQLSYPHQNPDETLENSEGNESVEKSEISHNSNTKIESSINAESIGRIIDKQSNWKAPGPDGIQNGYWKTIQIAKNWLIHLIIRTIETTELPKWLCKGKTVLIYKNKGDPEDPSNYRPITLLNNSYKILTKIIANIIRDKVVDTVAYPREQRAIRIGQRGCQVAILRDIGLSLERKFNKMNLETGFIDISKAYDSVPKNLLIFIINSLKLSGKLTKILIKIIKNWATKLCIRDKNKTVMSSKYKLGKGLLQGDSLSPILFNIAISPLSFELNKLEVLKIKNTKVKDNYNHQIFMDDIKIYANNPDNLRQLMNKVFEVTKSLGLNVNRGKTATTADIVDTFPGVELLDGNKAYKYLGIHQNLDHDIEVSKAEINKKILERSQKIFGSNLTIRQKIKAFNTSVVPMVGYIIGNLFDINNKFSTTQKMTREMDKSIRSEVLVKNKIRYSKSNKERLYIDCNHGGYGLNSIEDEFLILTIVKWKYLEIEEILSDTKEICIRWEKSNKRNPIGDGKKAIKLVGMNEEDFKIMDLKNLRNELKKKLLERRMTEWKKSEFKDNRDRMKINERDSNLWIQKGNLNNQGFRSGIGVQEKSIQVRTHKMFKGNNTNCRKCGNEVESIQHVLLSCPKWRTNLSILRHDSVCRNIHYVICKVMDIRNRNYHDQVPSKIENDQGDWVCWNPEIATIMKLYHRKPDLLWFQKKKNLLTIFEIAVADPNNLEKQEMIKMVRYGKESRIKIDHTNYEQYLNEEEKRTGKIYFSPNALAFQAITKYKCEVNLRIIIIGTGGEVTNRVRKELGDAFSLKPRAIDDVIERCQRAVIIGNSRIIKNHLA